MKDPTPYIDAALSSLQADIAARVDVFNAEPGQQVQLAHPASFFFGGSEKIQASEFPAIEVASPEWSLDSFSIEQLVFDLGLTVLVRPWTQEPEGKMPLLYRKSLGFARCALEVLLMPEAFGEKVKIERVQVFNLRPDIESRQFDYLTMASLIAFTLSDADSRPT